MTDKSNETRGQEKRRYVKPAVQVHKAATQISGSRRSSSSCYYSRRNFGMTYYH